ALPIAGSYAFGFYSGAGEQQVFYFLTFSFFPITIVHFLYFLPDNSELWNGKLRIAQIKLRKKFLYCTLYGFTVRNPVPRQVNPLKDILCSLLSCYILKCFQGYAVASCCTEPLAFVLRTAVGRKFTIRFT